MGWKQDLLGTINTEISRRHDATFAVHSIEQKEWGEFIVEDIFSTLHLFKPLKLDFIIIPKAYENVIDVGTILEKKEDNKGDDKMTGGRVVCKEFGHGEIVSMGFFGRLPIAFVKFDDSRLDGTFVLQEDLKSEIIDGDGQQVKIKQQDKDKDTNEVDDTERKLAYFKEMDRIRADALAEIKEIENMDNETLIEDFQRLIRNGAGDGCRRVVFMKRDMSRRMNRGDHL